jgi:hypothetical protein
MGGGAIGCGIMSLPALDLEHMSTFDEFFIYSVGGAIGRGSPKNPCDTAFY